jgi:heme-degrading monooxygenase HmoA
VVRGDRPTHFILWEYVVKAGSEAEFELVYGPEGDWARFLAKGEGYIATVLLRDAGQDRRYTTIDMWTSQEAYEIFRQRWEKEYKTIDARCEALTEQEISHGSFNSVGTVKLKGA